MAAIRLRGHHILCLLGYRGKGYSEEFVRNMTAIHQCLRTAPTTPIVLVDGPDDLCCKFPLSQEYHCEDCNVFERDQRVAESLSLVSGQEIPWGDIEARIIERLNPEDIDRWCASCPWRPYGVCAQGIRDLKQKKSLSNIPFALWT